MLVTEWTRQRRVSCAVRSSWREPRSAVAEPLSTLHPSRIRPYLSGSFTALISKPANQSINLKIHL